jgi:hypothetical protein
MRKHNGLTSLAVAGLLSLAVGSSFAGTMSVTWADQAGDPGPVGDVVSVQLSFDSNGSWTANWYADAAHPFTGNARFNLNLFDTALGNVQTAKAPQVSLDGFHDFGLAKASFYSYSGTTPYLSNWHVGDVVSSGNMTNFLSGAVNMNPPWGRDNLVTTGVITAAVPEPETWAMMLAGLGLLGVTMRRRKRQGATV